MPPPPLAVPKELDSRCCFEDFFTRNDLRGKGGQTTLTRSIP